MSVSALRNTFDTGENMKVHQLCHEREKETSLPLIFKNRTALHSNLKPEKIGIGIEKPRPKGEEIDRRVEILI